MQDQAVTTIDKNLLSTLDSEYHVVAKQAHTDLTPASDIQAAFLAPATFLNRPSQFEAAFDQILFHLDEAYRKTDEAAAQKVVSRMAETIFADLIFIIQNRLNHLREENKKGLLQKLTKSAQSITKNVLSLGRGDATPSKEKQQDQKPKLTADGVMSLISTVSTLNPTAFALVTIGPEVGNLFEAFTGYLTTKWEVEKEESYFYNQLVHVYEKILDSACYDSRGLLQNTFIRNKEQILFFVVEKKGITAALNLSKYDTSQTQSQETARLIVMSLAMLERWNEASTFLLELKKNSLPNFIDIQNQLTQAYKAHLESNAGILGSDKKAQSNIDVEVEKYTLKSTDPEKYDAFIRKLEKTKRNKKIISTLKIAAVLSIICGVFVVRWTNYQKAAHAESSRINTSLIEVSNLISKKEYQQALSTIESAIIWNEEKTFLSGDDEDKTEALKTSETRKVLQSIVEDLSAINKTTLDDSAYGYLNQKFLAPYNYAKQHVDKSDLNMFEETMHTVLSDLDNNRHQFLLSREQVLQEAIKKGDFKEAMVLANGLYHYSESKYKAKLGVFATSYKEFWEGEKEKLIKSIQQLEASIGKSAQPQG